eukprot:87948_1
MASWFPVVTLLLFAIARSRESCSTFTTEIDCDSQGACGWTNSICHCTSPTELDILFAIDGSGSMGLDNWIVQKNFIKNLTVHEINIDVSKIGFATFSRSVNFSRSIQSWQTIAELENYVSGLRWPEGWTYTWEAINQSVLEFTGERKGSSYTPDPNRKQVLILITDGNPCGPASIGSCPSTLCPISGVNISAYNQYLPLIQDRDIRTIIVAIGPGVNTLYLDCLTQMDTDFITVSAFNATQFDAITAYISDVFCYVQPKLTITEVQPMKKPSSWNAAGDGRYTRFVEFYNRGIKFNLNEIIASGLITMPNHGPNVTVPKGAYVVFYDAAADAPYPGMPSCHLCDAQSCDLSSCVFAGDLTNTGYCWCSNAIYVACRNKEEADCSNSLNADAGTLPYDACDLCSFNDTMTKTDWSIAFYHGETGDLIDDVVYTDQWIETGDRSSYELWSRGFSNDDGDNWFQLCPLGSPGADPPAACITLRPTSSPTALTLSPTASTLSPTLIPSAATLSPTQRPTLSPTASTLPPTAWEDCIDEAISLSETTLPMSIFIKINPPSQEMELILTSSKNMWFAIGFGSDTMDGTFVITAALVEGSMVVTPRRLGYHTQGDAMVNTLDDATSTVIGGSRWVTVRKSWTMDGLFDFSDFFEGRMCELPVIWAVGSGNSVEFGNHGANNRGSTVLRSCRCTKDPTGSPTASPTKVPIEIESPNSVVPMNQPEGYLFLLVCSFLL